MYGTLRRPHQHSGTSISSLGSSMKNSFSAFEPGSGTSTPFPSAADALVARLRLDCGLGVPTINIFLDILHHPLFKLEELTVRDAANIDLAVAAHHGDLQRIRERTMAVSFLTTTSNTPLCLCSFAEIPYPILERILDAIATDVDLLDEAVQYQVPLVNIAGRRSDCLRTLALVHRSWTVPSQQRLAARIVARTPSALLRLLRSPLPGRHTEELIVALGDVWNNGYHYDGTNRDAPARPGDVESDLCNLLKRLPRLKSFMLKESGLLEDMILPEVSKLVSLQSLSWHCAHGYPSCDFTHLVEALRSLPNLSSLEISGWSFHAASGIICGAPLRQQLKELRICVSPGDMQLDRVGWLLQALAVDERGTKLILDITLIGTLSMTEVFRLFPDARLALGRLDTLHIINKGGFVEFNLAQARTLLQACSSVRHLHIQGQTAPISEFLDILPPTLEELCFSWSDMWKSPWNLVEIHLPGLIQSGELDELRRVVVFNYEIPFIQDIVEGDGESPSHPCPRTQKCCDERSIELDLQSKPPDWRSI